jgi:hypothetical protein
MPTARTSMYKIVAAMVALGVFAASAHGQSVPAVNSALETIRTQDNLLGNAYDNLRPMGIGQDQDAVGKILDDVNLFRIDVGIVVAVGNVLVKMRDPEDAKAARVQLQYSLSNALKVADITLNYTNSFMALVKSAAALAEATKARDAMIAIRDQLRSLST